MNPLPSSDRLLVLRTTPGDDSLCRFHLDPQTCVEVSMQRRPDGKDVLLINLPCDAPDAEATPGPGHGLGVPPVPPT